MKVFLIVLGCLFAVLALMSLAGGAAEPRPGVSPGVEAASDAAWGIDTLLIGAASAGFFIAAAKRGTKE